MPPQMTFLQMTFLQMTFLQMTLRPCPAKLGTSITPQGCAMAY